MGLFATGRDGIVVESVAVLYEEFERMNVAAYYQEHGGRNPFAGRCDVIPKTAKHYIIVPSREEGDINLARAILKGLGKRKKVRETLRLKNEINYNNFAPTESMRVLYV